MRVSPVLSSRSSLRNEITSPVDDGEHLGALHPGRVAVITGAASGIGLAAAKELASEGLKIVLADIDEEKLADAGKAITQLVGEQNVLVVKTDVSKLEEVERLKDRVLETFGEVSFLFNNAGVAPIGGAYSGLEAWKATIDVNLWGVLNVQNVFVPIMMFAENPSIIVNTGSKNGITNPPGNAAYNASQAAIKSISESLAYELRSKTSNMSVHLLLPGWTHTAMMGAVEGKEKPAGAWTPQQTVQHMLNEVRHGKFYIICPDNETPEALTNLRFQWANDDLTESRPALSRWHPVHRPLFEEFISHGLAQEGINGTSKGININGSTVNGSRV